jgi:hypothetical protein
VKRDLRSCPVFIVRKFMAWVGAIELDGLEQTSRLPGYHDKPFMDNGKDIDRSIRLNRSYRAIYSIQDDGFFDFVRVETVNKHEY